MHGLSVGEQPPDASKFTTLKAEAYWNARSCVLAGGKLQRDDRFLQLAWIKDKVTTDKVIRIEPKVNGKYVVDTRGPVTGLRRTRSR